MNKTVFFAAALLLTPLPALSQQAQQSPSQSRDQSQDRGSSYSEREGAMDLESGGEDLLDRLSRSDLRERLSSAAERIEDACGDDIERFCGDITPGGGRVANCMQAYGDQLSRRCRFTLRLATRQVRHAVENIANACMSSIQQQCGDTENIKGCLQQKSSALPQSCQTIVAAIRMGGAALAARARGQEGQEQAEHGQRQPGSVAQAQPEQGQEQGALKGMPVFSQDGTDLGQIIQVERSPDGKILSVQIQVGRLLGLGEKVITVSSNKIQQLADRVRVLMNSDQIRSLPEARTEQHSGSPQR